MPKEPISFICIICKERFSVIRKTSPELFCPSCIKKSRCRYCSVVLIPSSTEGWREALTSNYDIMEFDHEIVERRISQLSFQQLADRNDRRFCSGCARGARDLRVTHDDVGGGSTLSDKFILFATSTLNQADSGDS